MVLEFRNLKEGGCYKVWIKLELINNISLSSNYTQRKIKYKVPSFTSLKVFPVKILYMALALISLIR